MNQEVQINIYTITVLESLFKSLKDAEYEQIFDAAVFLYSYVSKEGIYPSKIVGGFYSAMEILSDMSSDQFWLVKSLYN